MHAGGTTWSNLTFLIHFTSVNFLIYLLLYALRVIPFITLWLLSISRHALIMIFLANHEDFYMTIAIYITYNHMHNYIATYNSHSSSK